MSDITVYTVGHSTHPIDEFIDLLETYGVRKLIDVRTIAKSRHNPQFGEAALAASVRARKITYRRMKALGVAGMDVADAGLKWTGWSFAAGWKLRN